jgi:hypothetical protein
MIIGRENTEKELNAQAFLMEKVQPCLSQMTDELLKSKPKDPVPAMIEVLNRMATEAHIKRAMVRQFKNL